MTDSSTSEKLECLTFSRWEIDDFAIDTNVLRRNCPLDQTSSRKLLPSNNAASILSLGQLDIFPLETIQNILQYLDLRTLMDLRSVNQRSTLVVDSLPQYKYIVTPFPDALRAMLGTQMARYYSSNDLASALLAEDCHVCGAFGAFLSLLECRRCCWTCLDTEDDLLPLSKETTKDWFGLTDREVQKLPFMLSLPGSYELGHHSRPKDMSMHQGREALVSQRTARESGEKLYGGQKAMEAYLRNQHSTWARGIRDQRLFDEERIRMGEPGLLTLGDGLPGLRPPYHPSVADPEFFRKKSHRWMAAIRCPAFDQTTGQFHWGILCKGCGQVSDELYAYLRDGLHAYRRVWERMYTERGFFDHFERCGRSQDMWASYLRESEEEE